jgi:hypothetical protein
MGARIQMQLSVGLDNGVYDTWHKTVYSAAALPVLYISQHAEVSLEDAAFFKTKVRIHDTARLAGQGKP